VEIMRDPEILARMKATSDLYEAAEDLMRQRLRREHPGASAAEIEQRLIEWLQRPRED
jgi:hypothetical protein